MIATADAHLTLGLTEVKAGHLNGARAEFDRAVDVYLNAPGGAYSSPRLGEAYRRTLETIHVKELQALAAGDGFTETLSEPASIDEVGDLAVTDAHPSEELRKVSEAALREETTDFPVALNDSVLACVDLYQGNLREWFRSALARGGRYLPRIREVFAGEGVPQDLAYVALVESAFKTSALSRVKAKGVWQFMPATGKRFGLRQDWWVDERSNPEKSTRAAAQYLKQLYDLLGDWNLALAGYNSGEGTIQRAMNRIGTSDFWQLAETRALPRETRNYVPMIHAAILVAKAPDKYGFDIRPEAPLSAETVAVRGAFDLRVVAECAETGVDEVQGLNPELRRLATPAYGTFELKVPHGSGESVRHCLDSIPAARRVTFRMHVVARGQTLASVARRYGARTQDIASANGLSARAHLAKGRELIIPIDPRMSAPAVRRAAQDSRPQSDQPGRSVRISYRVKAGDTLVRIASYYKTSVRDIISWNKLRGNRIAAGNTLTIYTQRPTD